ncbi:hypothetical protein B1F79_01840 [Coxiella-like endosymbiont of Rhipicephalus sanguineus]|nr:hypothetical protein [Coxiella-like endosymbiont of Rhipicephalus sanguineus]
MIIHGVNIFYTAPTAIRALMREEEEVVKHTSCQTLKLLGTVGASPLIQKLGFGITISLEKNIDLLSTHGGKQKPAIL